MRAEVLKSDYILGWEQHFRKFSAPHSHYNNQYDKYFNYYNLVNPGYCITYVCSACYRLAVYRVYVPKGINMLLYNRGSHYE